MSLDDLLNTVEQILPPSRFGAIERFILQQTWLGQTYSQMAQESGYGGEYIKEVGSRLWQDLSDAVGERVTKKNLQLIFNRQRSPLLNSQNLSQNLHNPSAQKISRSWEKLATAATESRFSFPSGPIPIDSPFYIERPPIEALVSAEIKQPGCVIRIKACRQMGKSSLLHRIVAYARSLDYCTVHLDFREADQTIFSSLDRFLRWFCINISRRLQLEPDLESYWDEEMGSKVSCKIYFSTYLLEQINAPIVLVLNEVNQLFEYPDITQDFLPMLRFWHEQAKQDETWQKLRLVLAHTTDVYVPLNLNQSPFNVGLAVKLPPFTAAQVQELAQRYELNWTDATGKEQAALLQRLVGGHPYLVSLALYHLRQGDLTMDQLLKSAATPAGLYSSHLRQILSVLQENSELLSALQQVVVADAQVQLEAIAAHKLESMGLIQLEGKLAQPSCELYRSYFYEQLSHQTGLPIQSPSTLSLPLGSSATGSVPGESTNSIASHPASNLPNHLPNHPDRSPQLINYQSLHQSLAGLWQEAIDQDVLLSLIRCEVDYFQYFVDAYGPETGESCLQEIARTIQECAEFQQVLISRHGHAEFTIVISKADLSTIAVIAESIRANVQALAIAHDHSRVSGFPSQVITVSVGVSSVVPDRDTVPDLLLSTAERALHQARRQGRNRVSLHSA